jgi:hypothetical protein
MSETGDKEKIPHISRFFLNFASLSKGQESKWLWISQKQYWNKDNETIPAKQITTKVE